GCASPERGAAVSGIFAVAGRPDGVSAERIPAGAAERARHGRRAAAERRRLQGQFPAAGADPPRAAEMAEGHAGSLPMTGGVKVAVSARGISTILLNRPERSNAIDQPTLDGLAKQFAALAADDRARVVVLRGAGKHFCAGADLVGRA